LEAGLDWARAPGGFGKSRDDNADEFHETTGVRASLAVGGGGWSDGQLVPSGVNYMEHSWWFVRVDEKEHALFQCCGGWGSVV
jgi:hypothetical protein